MFFEHAIKKPTQTKKLRGFFDVFLYPQAIFSPRPRTGQLGLFSEVEASAAA